MFIAGETNASQHTFSTRAGKIPNLLDVRSEACTVDWFSYYPGYSLLYDDVDEIQSASRFGIHQVFIKVSIQSVLVMNLEEDEIFTWIYVFSCFICRFANKWRCDVNDQIFPHGDSVFSVHSAEVMFQAKKSPVLLTLACWSREKREEMWEASSSSSLFIHTYSITIQ